MTSPTIVLATASAEWEARVRKAFDGRLNGDLTTAPEVCTAVDPLAAVHALLADEPRVVVFGPDCAIPNALAISQHLDTTRLDVAVVLAADPTPEIWEQALRAGVRDIVPPDASLVDVRRAIEHALETAERRRAAIGHDITAPPRAGVIAVVSPKGGAGKTAISTNLSVGLANAHPNEVVIVDLDLQFGDVANAMRITPETTIADVAHSLAALDATTLKAFLTPHPTGVLVLCAPPTPADADNVGNDDIGKILDLLAGIFRYVVIDTAAGLDEVTLAALEHATDLVVVCGTDVASARGARKELEAFDVLGYTSQRRHFVLNRADARVGLSVGDIEATVGMTVDVAIPSSRAVPLSMNEGTPLLEAEYRSPVSRAFGELVHTVAGRPAQTEVAETRAGLFRRLKETR